MRKTLSIEVGFCTTISDENEAKFMSLLF